MQCFFYLAKMKAKNNNDCSFDEKDLINPFDIELFCQKYEGHRYLRIYKKIFEAVNLNYFFEFNSHYIELNRNLIRKSLSAGNKEKFNIEYSLPNAVIYPLDIFLSGLENEFDKKIKKEKNYQSFLEKCKIIFNEKEFHQMFANKEHLLLFIDISQLLKIIGDLFLEATIPISLFNELEAKAGNPHQHWDKRIYYNAFMFVERDGLTHEKAILKALDIAKNNKSYDDKYSYLTDENIYDIRKDFTKRVSKMRKEKEKIEKELFPFKVALKGIY